MVGKRRAAAKARVEAKKRTPTPPDEPSSSESVDKGLPTRLEEGQPLPTLNEPQSKGLSSRDGILAASLQRSRDRWLSEGIFERYWTKPSKKKSQMETRAPNPPKDTMVKLGPCTLTIEPHVFEVMLYTVKEPQSLSQPPAPGQLPQRPILQYGPPSGVAPKKPQHVGNHGQLTRNPTQASQHTPTAPPLTTASNGSAVAQRTSFQTIQTPAPINGNVIPPQDPPPVHNGIPGPSMQAPKPSPDPVIQMLATKAATDHELKALMRVVASGKATHPQLKVFQGHIDELTAILNSQGNTGRPFTQDERLLGAPPGAGVLRPSSHVATTPRPNGGALGPSIASRSTTAPTSLAIRAEHPAQSQTTPQIAHVKPRGHVMSHKPDITAILFEFAAGSGDRFLFPKYSILEYLPGSTQVIASFLVVRKGSNSVSGNYDPVLDYYQPVTMRLAAQTPKILEPLVKVVADPAEARKYMDDIMDNMTRAEYVHLAMRLPRDPHDIDDEDEGGPPDHDSEGSIKAVPLPTKLSILPKRKKQNLGRAPRGVTISTDRSSAEPWPSLAPKPDNKLPRSRKGRVADPTKACHLCHTSTTSLWRKAEVDGESVTVCNACGIKWKTNSTRAQEAAQAAASGQPPPKKMRISQKSTSANGQGSLLPASQATAQHPNPVAADARTAKNEVPISANPDVKMQDAV
ncbi:hypothetical protein FGG08_006011 [Glutinoglossum americanum]|uniref:GATA-type domain-containing protein n=1 Tax=Glutinoglossum americanum TaxID=1670608 RepID=A0A9P8I8A5_9PEZI|nr:hypothetical protein FGG08_006011 [Glutinoglossum americanum]